MGGSTGKVSSIRFKCLNQDFPIWHVQLNGTLYITLHIQMKLTVILPYRRPDGRMDLNLKFGTRLRPSVGKEMEA